jgi:hypothetical protein
MTSRERVLVIVFLTAVTVLGGGGMFHLFFLKPYNALRTRLQVAQKEIDAKKAEIKSEEDEIRHAEKLDPRLTRWDTYSLPDTTNRETEKLQRHVSDERVKYESYLFELLKESGFQGISTASKEADARSVPQYANKLPVYTRLTYTVEAKASFNSVVKMFKTFYGAEKLHQVREFKIRKPLLQNVNRGPAPVGPIVRAADGQNGPDRGLLDVTMTVEALIVTGAKPREARKPEDKPRPAAPQRPGRRDADPLDFDAEEAEEQVTTPVNTATVSILAPHRHYEDMLERNIYTGRGADGTLTENPRDVLGAVRLVMIEHVANPEAGWFDPPKIWKIEFIDQGVKDKYYRCTPDKADDNSFNVKDKYGSKTVIKGTVVDANIHGVVIKVDNRYHKMKLGDFFDEVMNPPLAENGKVPLDPEREPLDKYTRGSWTGLPTPNPEEPSEILKVVTLAKTTDTGRRWEVKFADPVRKEEYTCTPDSSVINAFALKDRKNVVVLSGTVVDANTLGAVIKVDNLFYKIKIGQSFKAALDSPLKEYTRGDWKVPPTGEDKKDEKTGDKGK